MKLIVKPCKDNPFHQILTRSLTLTLGLAKHLPISPYLEGENSLAMGLNGIVTKPNALRQTQDLPNNRPNCLSFFYKEFHLKVTTLDKEIDELKSKAVTAMTGSNFDRAKVFAESAYNKENKKKELKVNDKMDEECYFLSEDDRTEQFYNTLYFNGTFKDIHSCMLQNTFKRPHDMPCILWI